MERLYFQKLLFGTAVLMFVAIRTLQGGMFSMAVDVANIGVGFLVLH